MLAGMAADTNSGQCLIQHARAEIGLGNTVAYEFFEGSSLLEQRHALQPYSASLASQARDAWKLWESVGQVGSIIILGMKRFLVYGEKVSGVRQSGRMLRT